MTSKLFLNTEGYQVSFEMKTIPDLPDEFEVTISFRLDPRLDNVTFTSTPSALPFKELQALADYFTPHIELLKSNPNGDSDTFVPLDLQFQLQAFAGEVRSPDDGEFTLQFMINMGKPEKGSTSVYVGGEGVVTLEEINRFLASVKRLLADTSH